MHASPYPDFEPRFPWRGPDLQTLRNVVRGPALLVSPETPRTTLELSMRDGSEDRLVAFHLTAEPRASLRSDPPLGNTHAGAGTGFFDFFWRGLFFRLQSVGAYI